MDERDFCQPTKYNYELTKIIPKQRENTPRQKAKNAREKGSRKIHEINAEKVEKAEKYVQKNGSQKGGKS